jgi:hypothetical protein
MITAHLIDICVIREHEVCLWNNNNNNNNNNSCCWKIEQVMNNLDYARVGRILNV